MHIEWCHVYLSYEDLVHRLEPVILVCNLECCSINNVGFPLGIGETREYSGHMSSSEWVVTSSVFTCDTMLHLYR